MELSYGGLALSPMPDAHGSYLLNVPFDPAILPDPAARLTSSRHVACKKFDMPELTKLM